MFLHDEVESPIARFLLGHGAGAPMDHPWMQEFASLLKQRHISVTRFEFEFMAARRTTGKRRPAPRGDKLVPEFEAAVALGRAELGDNVPWFIGGKSLGGRVASMAAPTLFAAGKIVGLVCLGYPFHPAAKPGTLRTEHLAEYDCPALIVQGTRDPLGNRDEVEGYELDHRIGLHWLEDGDHDLKPRKKSGFTFTDHMQSAADAVAQFARKARP